MCPSYLASDGVFLCTDQLVAYKQPTCIYRQYIYTAMLRMRSGSGASCFEIWRQKFEIRVLKTDKPASRARH